MILWWTPLAIPRSEVITRKCYKRTCIFTHQQDIGLNHSHAPKVRNLCCITKNLFIWWSDRLNYKQNRIISKLKFYSTCYRHFTTLISIIKNSCQSIDFFPLSSIVARKKPEFILLACVRNIGEDFLMLSWGKDDSDWNVTSWYVAFETRGVYSVITHANGLLLSICEIF